MNDLISVIVPIYKAESYLDKCIESIVNQTYKNIEVILVDDGSPDNCPKICDNWAKKNERIKVIHKQNGGVSSARNVGIENATGKYICFIDSDDSVENEYFEKFIKEIQNFELVVCGYSKVLNGEKKGKVLFSNEARNVIPKNQIMNLYQKVLISAPWAKFYQKSIIDENNIRFPEDMSLGEDMVFNFSYIDKIENIAIINESLYNYNLDNDNSLLRKYRKDLFDINKKLYNKLDTYVYSWNLDESQMQIFNNAKYYGYANVLFNTFEKSNSDGFYAKLKYNKQIIKSDEFKSILSNFDGKLNFGEKIGYKINSYLPIFLYYSLATFVKRLNHD